MTQTAFEYLQAVVEQCETQHAELPSGDVIPEQWSGVGFSIGEHFFVTPLDTIHEILTDPLLTHIPGASPWVLGIVNLRGHLVPIFDAHYAISGDTTKSTQQQRVIVTQKQQDYVGVLVQEVFGLKRFRKEDTQTVPDLPCAYQDHAVSAFKDESGVWVHINLAGLLDCPEMLQVYDLQSVS